MAMLSKATCVILPPAQELAHDRQNLRRSIAQYHKYKIFVEWVDVKKKRPSDCKKSSGRDAGVAVGQGWSLCCWS